jgi:hypothetical protein
MPKQTRVPTPFRTTNYARAVGRWRRTCPEGLAGAGEPQLAYTLSGRHQLVDFWYGGNRHSKPLRGWPYHDGHPFLQAPGAKSDIQGNSAALKCGCCSTSNRANILGGEIVPAAHNTACGVFEQFTPLFGVSYTF